MIRLSWDKENPEEVKLAERKFKEYIRRGLIAFGITADNGKTQIFTFNPELKEIFLIPIVEGG
jgi:hypothetical protein